ncbi:hypothetical protein ABZY20_33150 [Streptomyces sp. NPDC006624]|uniref:hypothetical protein n=1 Tax=Streptomyces sp. NPDC006624 TaxID=3154892 RepID=UPI00339F7119
MTATHGRSVLAAAAGLVVLPLLATGCGDSDGEPEPARTVTATTTAPGERPTSPGATTSSPGEDESTGPVRRYPDAEVVTESKGFTMLRTDDSVEEAGDFYVGLLEEEDWDIQSKYEGETSVHLLARKGGDGLTIQVSPTGSGTTISISYYGV